MLIPRRATGQGHPDHARPVSPRALLSKHERQLEQVLTAGIVTEVDLDAVKARVNLGRGIITDWIPWSFSRCGGVQDWNPPVTGEQVTVCSMTGKLEMAYIDLSIPYTATELNCNTPLTRFLTYGWTKDRELFECPFERIFFQTTKEMWWKSLPETGTFRWDIGDKNSLVWNKDRFTLKIGSAEYHFSEDGIRFSLRGGATEMFLDPYRFFTQVERRSSIGVTAESAHVQVDGKSYIALDVASIVSQVQGNAVVRITKDTIEHELLAQKVRTVLNSSEFAAMVHNAVVQVTQALVKAGLPGTDLVLTQTAAVISSPVLVAPSSVLNNAVGVGGMYAPGELPQEAATIPETVPIEIPAKPRIKKGKAPYYPRTKKPK